ncbi:hypothetical protein V1281_004233 [Nitrobacteraceae bacterium AZCC 2161]
MTLFGRWWQRPLADCLGVSKAKVMRWHQGVRPLVPVDDQLLDVISRRGLKDAEAVRTVEDLERAMARFVSKRAE